MLEEKLLVIGGAALASLPFFALGLLIRLGLWKSWYLQKYYPVIAMKGSRHLGIPLGLLILLTPPCLFVGSALFARVETMSDCWVGMGSFLLISGVVIAMWNPPWANPPWLQRLEAQYDEDTIRTLIANWRRMDRKEWGGLIETQQGLDELVRRAGVPVATTDRHGRPIER
jgi:hypothetical protein